MVVLQKNFFFVFRGEDRKFDGNIVAVFYTFLSAYTGFFVFGFFLLLLFFVARL